MDQGKSFDQLVEEGQAAERRGQRAQARERYELALHHLGTEADGHRASAVLRWIARTYQVDADMDSALDCIAAAIAVAEAWGDEAAAGHAINIEAVVRWQQGDLDEAERLYLVARARALRAADAKLAAMTAQNLGVIANIRGDFDEARKRYEASLNEYRALGLTKDVCVALNNLGLLHTHQRQWDAAERAFSEAVQITDLIGDYSARISLDVNLAEMWVGRGEYARAQQSVRHAMEFASRTGDSASIGQATKLLGIIARDTGDLVDADEQFRRAAEIAVARQDLLLEAEVAREEADLARRQGRSRQVLQHLNRAHKLFTQLSARRDLADIDRRTGRLEDEFLQVARRWGESIEAKDRYTQGHCKRVADLSCAIAAEAGFDERSLFWFRIGALLHDVGKLVIPEEVLNKPGKLSDEEWALMRSHTTAGAEMLADIEFPWDVRPIVLSHHERWDGKGYPHGLKGDGIPLVARILCVADVYDALTSMRSYKRALSHDEAMDVMRQDVGTMFDPAVFTWFERVAQGWPERTRVASSSDDAEVPREPDSVAGPAAIDTDDLTRMPLRRAFRETAERVLEARRTTERAVSLLVIDIDHFKLVNDTFGHLQGDDLLRMVADVIRVQTGPSDFVARYAGDEFVALLPGTKIEDAIVVGERLRASVEQMRCPRRDGTDEPVRVTLSIGAATAPLHGDTLDALFAAADGALYSSKRRGRNAVSAASGSGSARDATLLLDTFVGRAGERQRLTRMLDASARGVPGAVAVVGEAGVGKSTLLRQLAPEVGVRAGSLLVGRCLEADVRPPYGPWADVVAAIHATGLVPPRTWQELGRLVPALGDPTAPAGAPSPNAKYALLHELEEFLTAAAAARPLVVILDDVQWADAETWDALEFLVPRLDHQRLLVCLTIRSEDLPGEGEQRRMRLSRHECYAEIALGRLSREELEQWLRAVLGGQAPEAALVEHLAAHTEGNPLFAVQTLRMLAEDGGLRFDDGAWRYTPAPDGALPTAVRDLLARRIGRLTDATREILTVAAVFGARFDADLLVGASGRDENVVFDAIEEGVAATVLTPVDGRGPSAYGFTHGLLADVLRRAGSPLRLRRVHERVARILETHTPEAVAEIAAHFDRAGCSADALRHALKAGERAEAVYAYDAATACYEMAYRHARSLAEHADVQWRLAGLDEITGRIAEAEEKCNLVLSSYAAGASELGLLSAAKRMRERLRMARGAPFTDVLRTCTMLLDAARTSGDRSEAVPLLLMIAQLHGRLGDGAAAVRGAHEAIAEAERSGEPRLVAEAHMRLGSALLLASPADAIPHYTIALDGFTHVEDRRSQGGCHINIGVAHDRSGDHSAAELSYATALDVGREVKAADLTALASTNLGVLLMKTGRFAEAKARYEEALRLYTSTNNEPYRLTTLYNLAHLARERGDAAGATELYGAAKALAERLGQLDVHVGAICGVGLAELALGQNAAAGAHFAEASELLAGREDAWFQCREVLEALGIRLELVRGRRAVAVERLCTALGEAERHDQYAAVWLAAECAAGLREERDGVQQLLQKHAAQARKRGYAPLLRRLEAASKPA
ncbi:diguanylate cyclase [Gemmatirosa kalamazoonensis]|uniref:Diguanylate cyclase n=1 Tax=Gemmatirosa kalamazoonensis TaxID=861299 RepID=W0RE71_9BACT|nr:diguanylate cyclase [Gemmatirosa kalamazoonensis]AHG89111.1 diguanylate cyclase [Gemmatirosa kalamazoonensis]